MTKILNLDKIETKREKVIILNGTEHVMVTFTVKDYINQIKSMKDLAEINESDVEGPAKALEITVDVLLKAFPTVKRDEFEALRMEQLEALRGLVEDTSNEEAPQPEAGEEAGETV